MSERGEQSLHPTGLSRRDWLRQVALGLTSVGVGNWSLEAAQHVHRLAQEEKQERGLYQPKCFQPHEYETLQRLTELIIPADEVSGSALEAGAPEFIDLLCSQNDELENIYTGGLLWLDYEMERRYAVRFVDADKTQQTAMLDQLTESSQPGQLVSRPKGYQESIEYAGFRDYKTVPASPLGPGIRFFQWVLRMTVDAFYTSPEGIRDAGYQGNGARTKFEVPEEAIQYAFKRSPFWER